MLKFNIDSAARVARGRERVLEPDEVLDLLVGAAPARKPRPGDLPPVFGLDRPGPHGRAHLDLERGAGRNDGLAHGVAALGTAAIPRTYERVKSTE